MGNLPKPIYLIRRIENGIAGADFDVTRIVPSGSVFVGESLTLSCANLAASSYVHVEVLNDGIVVFAAEVHPIVVAVAVSIPVSHLKLAGVVTLRINSNASGIDATGTLAGLITNES